MNEWISASESVSCALSSTFPSVCSGLFLFVDVFVFVLSYIISYIISLHNILYHNPLEASLFLIREREWMNSDDRGVKEELGRIEGGETKSYMIKKIYFH